jgi:hypothetical protein
MLAFDIAIVYGEDAGIFIAPLITKTSRLGPKIARWAES